MKLKILIIVICNLLICNLHFAQNITNTLGTSGLFKIKDGATDYFTLTQSTGQVNILKSLRLENTTSSTVGALYMGANRFLHNYGSANTFVGVSSGNFTMSGSNNSAFGDSSLVFNSTGDYNSAFGYYSLRSNTMGYRNSAFGNLSLTSNTTGDHNSAFGNQSLYYSTTGIYNSAFGSYALYSNTTEFQNSAFGTYALYSGTGNNNSAFGYQSLQLNTTGDNNTAIGGNSGSNITSGNNNTTVGYNAQVPLGVQSNQVRIGNTSVTYAGVQVAWTITSDRRWKSNIQNSNLGLDFIRNLRPVSYIRINDEMQKTEYGFIAQEMEETLNNSGTENPGMITIDEKGNYELRYNDLMAPMVKAIQELNTENEKLKEENIKLADEISRLRTIEERLAKLESKLNKTEETKEINNAGK